MTTDIETRPVLLLGSVPLQSAGDVFEQAGSRLGSLLGAVPDGETGERLAFILWLMDRWRTKPGLAIVEEMTFHDPTTGGPRTVPFFGLAPGFGADQVDWSPMGYADFAVRSYAEFTEARAAGALPAGVRFQVALPTPAGFALLFPHDRDAVLPGIEREMASEVAKVLAGIPDHDLTIQWDAPGEVMAIERIRQEGAHPGAAAELLELATASLARMIAPIPDSVAVGVHLCYGDPDGHHVIEPNDSSLMVDFTTRLIELVERRVDYVHMPVPIERDDNAYFAPLDDLELPAETMLYLGLVHLEDGVEGAGRRAQTAIKHVPRFGIAAECGLGRERPGDVSALLELHREVAEAEFAALA